MNKSKSKPIAVLITIGLICFSTVAAVVVFVVLKYSELDTLRASLKSKLDLQTELLSSQNIKGPHIAHTVDQIAYVLNPNFNKSNYRAAEGDYYLINALGLRGKEIRRKREGHKRVVIVGDSVVFGWKLRREQRLENKLASMFEATMEFVTVGLPGWNTKDQNAFLTTHLDTLNPDIIVWFVIPNDVFDSPGVLPNGNIAHWLTPHAEDIGIYTRSTTGPLANDPISPVTQRRQGSNFTLIRKFKQKYNLPVVIVSDQASLINFNLDDLQQHAVYVPEKLVNDRRWNVDKNDSHPSEWANSQLAYLIVKELQKLLVGQSVVKTPVEPQEDILDLTESVSISPSRQQVLRWAKDNIATQFTGTGTHSPNLLAGITNHNKMRQSGAMYLTREELHKHVVLKLKLDEGIERFPQEIDLTVEQLGKGRAIKTNFSFVLDNTKETIQLNLTKASAPLELLLVTWKFDRENCSGPSECSSAKFVSAKVQ